MTDPITDMDYPKRREQTRMLDQKLQAQVSIHLNTVRSQFRAAATLGRRVAGGTEHTTKSEAAYKKIAGQYADISVAAPFSLAAAALPDVLEISAEPLKLFPFVYRYKVGDSDVEIRRPLHWVVAYSDFPPARLRELVAAKERNAQELRRFLIQYLSVSLLVTGAAGVVGLFDSLRFPIRTELTPELGPLPLTVVTAPAGTVRPPDDVIQKVVYLSGVPVIEEVLDLDDWSVIRDPILDAFNEVIA